MGSPHFFKGRDLEKQESCKTWISFCHLKKKRVIAVGSVPHHGYFSMWLLTWFWGGFPINPARSFPDDKSFFI